MRRSPLKWFPPLSLLLPAVGSGALLALAFPPFSYGPIALVALSPMIFALYRVPRGPRLFFKTGYIFGCSFFLAHLWWIVELSDASSIRIPWLMGPAVAGIVLYLAVYPGLFFWLLRLIGRGHKLSIPLLAPALWVLIEWFRSNGELGFPWAGIGHAFARFPSMAQGAAIYGVLGVGAWIVFVNMLWGRAFLTKSVNRKTAFVAAGLILVAINVSLGRRTIARLDSSVPDTKSRIAIVQPNVDLALKWKPEFTDSTFRLIDRLSRSAAGFDPDLIIFPETCAPVYLRHNRTYRPMLQNLVAELGVELYIGFLDGRYDGPEGDLNVYNSSGLLYPGGTLALYDKQHLLPVGETFPFSWKFRWLKKIDFGQANFQPGPERKPIPSKIGNLAPLICFESIFPGPARKAARRGAEVFINITNDGWFGGTPGPHQHNDMAILRSIENRRFLVRSANTGVTMIVGPTGHVVADFGMNREGILIDEIYTLDETTLYTRYGDVPLLLASILMVFGWILWGLRSRGGRV